MFGTIFRKLWAYIGSYITRVTVSLISVPAQEGCGAHKIKKKTRNLLGGGTFDHEFFGPVVSFARSRFCCSRKAKSCFSPKTGSWWQHPRKTSYHPKSVHIDVTLCVESEYVIKKTIGARNFKIIIKNRFSFLLLREVFFISRKIRYDQTDFRNGFYTSNRTSKSKFRSFRARVAVYKGYVLFLFKF